jgi:hypothetical protein
MSLAVLNYLHFYSPAIIPPSVEVVLLFGVCDSVKARWKFAIFSFPQINRWRCCLLQQMSDVKRRIFIYLQLTYDWLPLFCIQWLQWCCQYMNFHLNLYPGKHVRTVVANIMFVTVLCIILIFLQQLFPMCLLHKLFLIFVEYRTSVISTTLLI